MTEPTYCSQCDYVHADTRKMPPYRWLCTQHRRADGQGFVDPDYWSRAEPYLKCDSVNGGFCPLFRRRIEGQQENGL